ncbi:MAG: outer membrane beta-barrel protein, partial [Bacteroidales bacterium]|nr:outer membrane beta-barrel protein [Bacteroidales bacterium]
MKHIIFCTLRFALCTSLIFCAFTLSAQSTKFSVYGTVLDEKNVAVPFTTAALYRAVDSTLFGGATTEINGKFKINNVPAGKYIAKISFVGYNTLNKEITVSQDINLGNLQLFAGIELDAFEVRETYIPVQTIDDTVVFSAEAFRAPEGSALEELLKRFPGAEVDKDGKITINGKEVTKILVNGKKFFDDDPKMASKNLPANIIDKVQFYEKQSDQSQFSGIDDGENENVINLTIKPGKQKGVFGNITLAGGSNIPQMSGNWKTWKFKDDFRFNNSLSLNYFRDNDQLSIIGSWNNCNNVGFTNMMAGSGAMIIIDGGRRGGGAMSFGSNAGIANSASIGINFSKQFSEKVTAGGDYQYGFTKNYAEMQTHRENIYNTGNTFYDENKTNTSTTHQHRLRFEVDYKIDTVNTINIRPNLSFATNEKDEFGTYQLFDAENAKLNNGTENIFTQSWSLNANLEAQYRHKFAKPRRTLWLSLEGGIRIGKGTENNITQNIFYNSSDINDSLNQKNINKSNRYSYAARVGYTEPLTQYTTLELRYSFSQSIEDKEKQAYNYDYSSESYSLLDTTYSTIYSNHFMQHRLEARVQWQYSKINWSLGFGAYPSTSNNLMTNGNPYKQTVWNYAPSLQLNYRPSKMESLRVFYRGRVEQPSMTQLQPVPDNSEALNIKLGNMDLLPSFQPGLRMMYNKSFKTTASIFAMLMG